MASALSLLGIEKAWIVHGMDGLDEATLTDRTRVSEGKAGVVTSYFVEPKDFGLSRVRLKELLGGTVDDNAHIIREVLQGRRGPKRDIVSMNAALALVAGRKVKTLPEGFELAGRVIDSGAAMDKLERLVEFTKRNS